MERYGPYHGRKDTASMASVEECRVALAKLVTQFDEIDEESRAKHVVERTVSCRVSDLGVTFYGRLHHGGSTRSPSRRPRRQAGRGEADDRQ